MSDPLVLLHAFPLRSTMYDALRGALGPDLDLHTPDLPGFGGQPLPPAAPSLDAVADAVAAGLDAAGLDRVVLGGTSMGGYATMAFLRRHPQRVSALVLVDTTTVADSPERAAGREAMARRLVDEGTPDALLAMLPNLLGATTHASRPDVVAAVRSWVEDTPPASAAWAQRAMAARPDSLGTLRGCGLPALVVVGAEDGLTPPGDARTMHEALPGSTLVELAGAGHLSPVEAPAQVAAAVSRFLAALP